MATRLKRQIEVRGLPDGTQQTWIRDEYYEDENGNPWISGGQYAGPESFTQAMLVVEKGCVCFTQFQNMGMDPPFDSKNRFQSPTPIKYPEGTVILFQDLGENGLPNVLSNGMFELINCPNATEEAELTLYVWPASS